MVERSESKLCLLLSAATSEARSVAVANWQCDVCKVFLEADDEGQDEPCPRCGENMIEVFLQEET